MKYRVKEYLRVKSIDRVVEVALEGCFHSVGLEILEISKIRDPDLMEISRIIRMRKITIRNLLLLIDCKIILLILIFVISLSFLIERTTWILIVISIQHIINNKRSNNRIKVIIRRYHLPLLHQEWIHHKQVVLVELPLEQQQVVLLLWAMIMSMTGFLLDRWIHSDL